MQGVHKAWLVQAALSKQAVGMLDWPGDSSHHPTKSQHKDLLGTCPASWCTGNCCCRGTAGLLHGHNWAQFHMHGKDSASKMCQVLPKCVTYVQNVSCTTRGALSTLPSRAGTKHSRKPSPWSPSMTKWHCWLNPGQQKAPSPPGAVHTSDTITRHKTVLDKWDQLIPTRHWGSLTCQSPSPGLHWFEKQTLLVQMHEENLQLNDCLISRTRVTLPGTLLLSQWLLLRKKAELCSLTAQAQVAGPVPLPRHSAPSNGPVTIWPALHCTRAALEKTSANFPRGKEFNNMAGDFPSISARAACKTAATKSRDE